LALTATRRTRTCDDSRGRPDVTNASSADLFGKSDADLFGREFAERTHLEDLRVMETDQPISGLVESRQLPDGSLNWTHTSKLPLHDAEG
jgi:PAS domain-containing protein